jgi:hypothetical protein
LQRDLQKMASRLPCQNLNELGQGDVVAILVTLGLLGLFSHGQQPTTAPGIGRVAADNRSKMRRLNALRRGIIYFARIFRGRPRERFSSSGRYCRRSILTSARNLTWAGNL